MGSTVFLGKLPNHDLARCQISGHVLGLHGRDPGVVKATRFAPRQNEILERDGKTYPDTARVMVLQAGA